MYILSIGQLWSYLDFSFLLIGNWEEKDNLKEEILSKKKPALNDLENSQPTQSASSENRAKAVSGETLAEEIRCVTYGSNQPKNRTQE